MPGRQGYEEWDRQRSEPLVRRFPRRDHRHPPRDSRQCRDRSDRRITPPPISVLIRSRLDSPDPRRSKTRKRRTGGRERSDAAGVSAPRYGGTVCKCDRLILRSRRLARALVEEEPAEFGSKCPRTLGDLSSELCLFAASKTENWPFSLQNFAFPTRTLSRPAKPGQLYSLWIGRRGGREPRGTA